MAEHQGESHEQGGGQDHGGHDRSGGHDHGGRAGHDSGGPAGGEATTARLALLARRGALERRIAHIEETLDDPPEKDWEEEAIQSGDDEVLEGMGLSAQQELRMIAAALARIEDGSYGQCTVCGADIAPRRLAVLPATPFCAGCAR